MPDNQHTIEIHVQNGVEVGINDNRLEPPVILVKDPELTVIRTFSGLVSRVLKLEKLLPDFKTPEHLSVEPSANLVIPLASHNGDIISILSNIEVMAQTN